MSIPKQQIFLAQEIENNYYGCSEYNPESVNINNPAQNTQQFSAGNYPVLETISLRILTASSLLMFSKFTSFTWRADKRIKINVIVSTDTPIFYLFMTSFKSVCENSKQCKMCRCCFVSTNKLIQPACLIVGVATAAHTSKDANRKEKERHMRAREQTLKKKKKKSKIFNRP